MYGKPAISRFDKREEVKTYKRVIYSKLVCQKCGHTEERRGKICMDHLPAEWVSLSLDTQGYLKVSEWLLCEKCALDVLETAGLKR